MNDSLEGQPKQPKGLKRIIILVVSFLLFAGVAVSAYLIISKTDKEKYFLAEQGTMELMKEEFEDRYQSEKDWREHSMENPIQSVLDLSLEYNDPLGMSNGLISAEQLINNSTITITTETDREEKELSTSIIGNIGGFEIGGFEGYLTGEKAMLGLPFLHDVLQLKGDDIGQLLSQLDPVNFTGDEKVDFGKFFEGKVLSEEDLEYLKEEYALWLYDEISEEAFIISDETINVQNEEVNSEKITFQLTEEELQELFSNLLDKMAQDDRLKEIIKNQYELQTFGSLTTRATDTNTTELVNEFMSALEEGSEQLAEFSFPSGLTSTIWTNDNVIVKRDFNFELGPNADEVVGLSIQGEHMNDGNNQSFHYVFSFSDQYDTGTVALKGDLSFEDNVITDTISLEADAVIITYEANETLTDDGKEFERSISFEDTFLSTGTINWTGEATYDNEEMQSNHQLTFFEDNMQQDEFTLHVAKDSKTIDNVELPSEDKVKDLGSMDIYELEMYLETEVAPQFEQWLYGIMGSNF